MREDMFKVIVERPRGGMRLASRNRTRLSGEDDLPTKIGVQRHVQLTANRTKHLSENFSPLKRFLRKQVGRIWNDVHSEICKNLTPGNVVKDHVRLHLKGFVAENIKIGADGQLRAITREDLSYWHPWHQKFYVDPRDGILRDSEVLWRARGLDLRPWKRHRPKPDPNVHKLDKTHELRRIAGVWYEITYVLEPDWQTDQLVYCLVQRTLVRRKTPYAVAKRQLSGTELKAHGIANQPVN